MQSCDVAYYIVYFYNDSPSTYFYTLSLHEALPILAVAKGIDAIRLGQKPAVLAAHAFRHDNGAVAVVGHRADRKSTRLNSSHVAISYAVFCLKKNILSKTFFFVFLYTLTPTSCIYI